ncbi:MAG TPA: hypothetical protein VF824_04730 [Thermoanaerobaculia bacterium]|jgi:hypothetical protein
MKRLAFGALMLLFASVAFGAPMSGAIFTTDGSCSGTNLNIFGSKDDVYLDGGPAHPHAAGLPDGSYFVQVTSPDGALLGSSTSAIVQVAGGEFGGCYRLSDIVVRASDAGPGYDDTSNSGGEYKVWVSSSTAFAENASKTDNFKVKTTEVVPPPPGHLLVTKFYDANANGTFDAGDVNITGWQVTIQDSPHVWIDSVATTPVDYVDEAGDFGVSESAATQQNWRATTSMQVNAHITDGQNTSVSFGNLCLGGGGGLTLGYWSNKNGQSEVGNDDMAMLVALNLRNADGSAFDPANYKAFRTWILAANATNMANMLSAQSAAMQLNVLNNHVSASSIVYAPGAGSANALGYATVGALLGEADALLGANGYTVGSGATRTVQEAVKTAIDRANNNLNFVQGSPCAFSFQ